MPDLHAVEDTPKANAANALNELGLAADESSIQQMMVLAEALAIFQERNGLRGDLWREHGWSDSLHHMRDKYSRVAVLLAKFGSIELKPEDLFDDALDLVNYTVFFIRNVRGT